jgi:hypothetical protein
LKGPVETLAEAEGGEQIRVDEDSDETRESTSAGVSGTAIDKGAKDGAVATA